MSKKRAISEDEKNAKRQLIINTAIELFDTMQYKEIKMIDIAKKASVAKGTVFVYFKTKEELFLEFAKQEFSKFYSCLNANLNRLITEKKILSVDAFLNLLLDSLKEARYLARLSAISNVIFEQNIGYEAAKDYKIYLYKNNANSGKLIEKCMPLLKKNTGSKLLFQTYIVMIGLEHVSNPTAIMKKVIEKEKLDFFQADFNALFRDMMRPVIVSLQKSPNSGA